MTNHDERRPEGGGVTDDPAAAVARDARREALGVVGGELDARVLEPSPPAVSDGQWFADEQVRVAGTTLVRQRGETAEAVPITSLNQAAEFVLDGPPDTAWAEGFDVPPAADLDELLPLDADVAALLGDWYGFGWSVLEEVRAEPASVDAGRTQLWPEHFDAAFDCLPEDRRCTFGVSPGDAAVPEPYLYVLPWRFEEAPPSEFWNSISFRGAILPFGRLVDADDQRTAALTFLRRGRALLEP